MHDHENTSSNHDDRNHPVQSLAGPRMPADRGLAGLGLMMQLSGSLYLGFMLLFGTVLLAADGPTPDAGRLLLLCAASSVRSAVHRSAGATLIYGTPAGSFRDPYAGIRLYITIALSHTLLCAWLLEPLLADTATLVSALALLAAWPVTLAVVIRLPALAALSAERPRSEDLGLEGASVLMLILGAVGLLVSALFLFGAVTSPVPVSGLTKVSMLLISGILMVRSAAHALAGKHGLSSGERAVAVAALRRYIHLGKLSTVVISVVSTVLLLPSGGIFVSFIWIGALVYFLLIWPLILDRFLDQYEIDAGMGNPVHRAPDAGLTTLGWLLLALGVPNLLSALAQLVLDTPSVGVSLMSTMDAWDAAAQAGRSPWLFLGVSGLQLWAALALCAMSPRARLAATAYGGVTLALTLYLLWPALAALGGFRGMLGALGGEAGMQHLAQLGLALVIPLVTLILANKPDSAVQARARYRAGRPE